MSSESNTSCREVWKCCGAFEEGEDHCPNCYDVVCAGSYSLINEISVGTLRPIFVKSDINVTLLSPVSKNYPSIVVAKVRSNELEIELKYRSSVTLEQIEELVNSHSGLAVRHCTKLVTVVKKQQPDKEYGVDILKTISKEYPMLRLVLDEDEDQVITSSGKVLYTSSDLSREGTETVMKELSIKLAKIRENCKHEKYRVYNCNIHHTNCVECGHRKLLHLEANELRDRVDALEEALSQMVRAQERNDDTVTILKQEYPNLRFRVDSGFITVGVLGKTMRVVGREADSLELLSANIDTLLEYLNSDVHKS